MQSELHQGNQERSELERKTERLTQELQIQSEKVERLQQEQEELVHEKEQV